MNFNVDLIPLRPEHQEYLRKMAYLAVYVPPGQKPYPRSIMNKPELAKYAENWGRDHDTGLIAVDRKSAEKTGAVWLRLFTAENPGFGYVDDATPELCIAVREQWRGKGIGTQLLREILNRAEKKYAAVSLSVTACNPALALYQRFGFEKVVLAGDSWTMAARLRSGGPAEDRPGD